MNFCELSFEKRVQSAEKNRYAESSISGAVNGEYSLLQTIKIDYNNPLCAPLQEQMNHTTSFECVAAEWLRMAGAQLKESSIVKYLNVLNHYLLPRYSGVPINEITRKNVTEYVQFLLTSGGCNGTGLSANTIFGILAIF